MKKQSKPQRGRRSNVRALVPLDTEKIRKNDLSKFKRSKTTCAKLTDQVEQFEKHDVPAFTKWLHDECEATLQKINTLRGKAFTLQNTLELAGDLCISFPRYSRKKCADAAVHYIDTNGESPEGFESFFQKNTPNSGSEEDPFDSFKSGPNGLDDAEAEAARKFFESLMDDLEDEFYSDPDFTDPFGPRKKTPEEKKSIKKLYRKITHKLHPDRVGNATPEQQDLWHAAQKAYQANDLETLQQIETSCDLFSDKLLRFSSVSSIRNGTDFYKQTNTKMRRILRAMKKELEWGFLSWTDQKKKRVLKRYTDDLSDDHTILILQHSSMQHELDEMRKEPRIKKRKSPTPAQPAAQDPNQAQFDFF